MTHGAKKRSTVALYIIRTMKKKSEKGSVLCYEIVVWRVTYIVRLVLLLLAPCAMRMLRVLCSLLRLVHQSSVHPDQDFTGIDLSFVNIFFFHYRYRYRFSQTLA